MKLSEKILTFKAKVESNSHYQVIINSFLENHALLESFWRQKFNNKGNSLELFAMTYGDFFWEIENIRNKAIELSLMEEVKDSNSNFVVTRTIQEATEALRDFHNSEYSNEANFKKNGTLFTLRIITQIRHNASHGRKTDLEENQFKRNRHLITISNEILEEILKNLENAEEEIG